MIIFPAIDIKNGKCVRLLKGDFKKMTSYKNSPIEQASKFFDNGFNNIHIIDLDGALQGKSINYDIIKKIIQKFKLKVQVGGGIRTIEDINKWIDIGADKIIMGTAAVENIDLLQNACDKFENKIAVALDVKDGFLHLSGWNKKILVFLELFTQI